MLKSTIFCLWKQIDKNRWGNPKDLVDILQGEVRKNGVSNLFRVSKVVVTSDLSVATVHLSIFPQEKAKGLLEAIKSNSKTIKHDLSQEYVCN
jgi:ribosome-binding factor A